MSTNPSSALIEKLKAGGEVAEADIARIPFGFEDSAGFALMQRAAQLMAASSLVPQQFRGNIADCVIAIEMARRLGASPLAVMQSMYIVHGRPAWSAQFIIACLNASGRFSPLRFEMRGEGPARACVAWAIDKAAGDRLEGPEVSIEMAKKEGWYDRKGKDGGAASKWPTMPELMLRYRAASFFGRLYAPDIMMGMQTAEEVEDRIIEHDGSGEGLVEKIRATSRARRVPPPEQEKPAPPPEVDHTPNPDVPAGDIGADEKDASTSPASTRKRAEAPAGMVLE